MPSRFTLLALGALTAAVAFAAAPVSFGPHDVQTLFAIAKSDNNNQVQYALRLDERCRPLGAEPIWGYWRAYDEGTPPPLLPFSWLDQTAYGIDRQAVDASAAEPSVVMAIRAAKKRPIEIRVSTGPDGACVAEPRATILGRRARLKGLYVKLGGLFVDYLEIRGVSLDDGSELVERVKP